MSAAATAATAYMVLGVVAMTSTRPASASVQAIRVAHQEDFHRDLASPTATIRAASAVLDRGVPTCNQQGAQDTGPPLVLESDLITAPLTVYVLASARAPSVVPVVGIPLEAPACDIGITMSSLALPAAAMLILATPGRPPDQATLSGMFSGLPFAAGNTVLSLPWDPGAQNSSTTEELSALEHELPIVSRTVHGDTSQLLSSSIHGEYDDCLEVGKLQGLMAALMNLQPWPSWQPYFLVPTEMSSSWAKMIIEIENLDAVMSTKEQLQVLPLSTPCLRDFILLIFTECDALESEARVVLLEEPPQLHGSDIAGMLLATQGGIYLHGCSIYMEECNCCLKVGMLQDVMGLLPLIPECYYMVLSYDPGGVQSIGDTVVFPQPAKTPGYGTLLVDAAAHTSCSYWVFLEDATVLKDLEKAAEFIILCTAACADAKLQGMVPWPFSDALLQYDCLSCNPFEVSFSVSAQFQWEIAWWSSYECFVSNNTTMRHIYECFAAAMVSYSSSFQHSIAMLSCRSLALMLEIIHMCLLCWKALVVARFLGEPCVCWQCVQLQPWLPLTPATFSDMLPALRSATVCSYYCFEMENSHDVTFFDLETWSCWKLLLKVPLGPDGSDSFSWKIAWYSLSAAYLLVWLLSNSNRFCSVHDHLLEESFSLDFGLSCVVVLLGHISGFFQ